MVYERVAWSENENELTIVAALDEMIEAGDWNVSFSDRELSSSSEDFAILNRLQYRSTTSSSDQPNARAASTCTTTCR